MLQRCKNEGVTFFGALTAAIVVAFYVAADEDKRRVSPFKLRLDAVVNMRQRVASSAPEIQVGTYMHMDPLWSFASDSVEVHSTRFWDLARNARKEVDTLFSARFATLRFLFLDELVNTKLAQNLLAGACIKSSVHSDVSVSNTGKYPYVTMHTFETANVKLEDLTIESLHTSGSYPHLGAAAGVFVMAIESLSYDFLHKFEDALGKKL